MNIEMNSVQRCPGCGRDAQDHCSGTWHKTTADRIRCEAIGFTHHRFGESVPSPKRRKTTK